MNARQIIDSEAQVALRAIGWTILREASDGIRAWRRSESIRLAYTTAGRTHVYAQDLENVLSMRVTRADSREPAQKLLGGRP